MFELDGAERREYVMAMEFHVLSERRLNSIGEWQRAIDAENFQLQLLTNTQLGALSGFVPVRLEGKTCGFECYHGDAVEVMQVDSELDFGGSWTFALSFRIVGDFAELRSAWMAATAYAHATGGVVFDPQEDKLYDYNQARKAVRDIERDWPVMEAVVQATIRKIGTKS
jgi:hypothetical protein